MTLRSVSLLALLGIAGLVAAAPAARASDPILEAAKKEQARREALKKKHPAAAKKTEDGTPLTNDSLKRAGGKAGTLSTVTPHHQPSTGKTGEAAAGEPGAPGAEDKSADAAKKPGETAAKPDKPAEKPAASKQDDAYWRGRVAEANGAVEAARKALADLNQRINDLRRSSSAIDDPNIRNHKAQELRSAEADLPKAQQAIADAQKGVDAVREEARRGGASPGATR